MEDKNKRDQDPCKLTKRNYVFLQIKIFCLQIHRKQILTQKSSQNTKNSRPIELAGKKPLYRCWWKICFLKYFFEVVPVEKCNTEPGNDTFENIHDFMERTNFATKGANMWEREYFVEDV